MADMTGDTAGGSLESRAEEKSSADLVARWLAEIDLSTSTEKDWRKDAEKARNIYRAEEEGKDLRFNILFSNVQTEVPSLFNSTPAPDVRTRYVEKDETARLTCQAIERVLSYSVDTYDFDGNMKAAVQDRQLAGRGLLRARYKPYEYQGQVYQEVTCEHVPWKHYRLGPGTALEDMPWVAFEHFLTREQLMSLAPDVGGGIELNMTIKNDGMKADVAPNVYKRACVWEIWDKQTRKVYWISQALDSRPVRVDEDPLGLTGFFPFPEPMYAVRTSGSMVPVCPYKLIAPLVDELEELTKRIQSLVKAIRWRGFKHPSLPSFERLSEAEDGELVDAAEDIMALSQGGKLENFIWLMPIREAVETIQALYVQREQVKQTIFEVSGLSDILRGQSDPNETLGAQEIKANFGSMRLQDGQKDVQRFCRDLFRIKAEIACNKFTSDNLKLMTGLKNPSRAEVAQAKMMLQQMQVTPVMGHNGGPPMQEPPPEIAATAQAVAWEDILELIKSGATRTYRIDIESDSTIRGEVRTQQQSASEFLQGTAQFIEAMGPAIQAGFISKDVAVDLYSSFARLFKLGKQADDALSRMGQQAQEEAQRPPQPAPPSPEEIKAKADAEKNQMQMQALMAKTQADMQAKQADHQMKREAKQADIQAKMSLAELSAAFKAREMEMDMANQQRQAELDYAIKVRDADLNHAIERVRATNDAERQDRDMQQVERKTALQNFLAEQKAQRELNAPPKGRQN